MIVGENVLVRGTIEGDEDLVVRGRVEGAVRVRGDLTVESSGSLQADVEARQAMISGTVQGNVTAVERIELTRTGRMAGDAVAPEVTIASGAIFRGRSEMDDGGYFTLTPAERAAAVVPAPVERRALPRETGDVEGGQVGSGMPALAPPPRAPIIDAAPANRPIPRLARPARVPLQRR